LILKLDTKTRGVISLTTGKIWYPFLQEQQKEQQKEQII
jgi:hypothetical protein